MPAPAEAALESPILTADELAALLRLNRKTVYEALSRGEIPCARRVAAPPRLGQVKVAERRLQILVTGEVPDGQRRGDSGNRVEAPGIEDDAGVGPKPIVH